MPIMVRLVLAYSARTPCVVRCTNARHACDGETSMVSGKSPLALTAHQTATRRRKGSRMRRSHTARHANAKPGRGGANGVAAAVLMRRPVRLPLTGQGPRLFLP